MEVTITPVSGRRELGLFIELAYRLRRGDPNWVPPLRSDMVELLTPGRNPFHEHARVQLFLARRRGQVVGRISAHIDELALAQPADQGFGPGTGNWGLLEAEDEGVAQALIARAEAWLREQGMTRVLAPISLSIWEEPGLLVRGADHPPTMMMGHHPPEHQGWIERAGYHSAKSLLTYEVRIDQGFPPLIDRIVASGERNSRITLRTVDMKNFARDAEIAIDILNDAWSENWGFVPFTDAEKAYGAKKLKPITMERTNMIAELDGEPVAFMLAWPDLNEQLIKMNGRLFPFNWAKLLWWLRKPQVRTFRVPLMGVRKRLQNSRLASQIAFMMIEYIRRVAVSEHGASRGEIGWVLDDNGGMIAIAEAIGSTVNKEFRIYEKTL
ncbi:N-acetyltransferase [Croceibacterium sp. TMG7-5b_MA50]|uniref:N-acetyltransferase n=1 Tax=Croceibacterium sp. TMG7-5b_MA50 TaxID=3121290 RepID=UPI0032215822